MDLKAMIKMLNDNVDDVVPNDSAIGWFNAGKDQMATAVEAIFPNITITPNMDDEFAFPAKFHETPVLYASAMFKAQDSSIQEKNSFMQQFMEGVKDFVQKYAVPPQYRDDNNTQQFTATQDQTEFEITKPSYNPSTGDLKVYVNGKLTENWYETLLAERNTFTLAAPANADDKVTALWEIHSYLNEPPHNWWTW